MVGTGIEKERVGRAASPIVAEDQAPQPIGHDGVIGVIHDLAEESKAGASLPVALSRVMRYSARLPSTRESLRTFSVLLDLGYDPVAAQRRITHGSWLVKVSMSILAVAFQTGGGYELLDKLSVSFRRISDARRSLSVSILPFAVLGVFVPLISGAAVWFLSGIGSLGSFLPNLAAPGPLR